MESSLFGSSIFATYSVFVFSKDGFIATVRPSSSSTLMDSSTGPLTIVKVYVFVVSPLSSSTLTVDPAAQVERDLTVIPEYFTEYQFRKDAAQILISATEKASHTEKEGIGTIFVFV